MAAWGPGVLHEARFPLRRSPGWYLVRTCIQMLAIDHIAGCSIAVLVTPRRGKGDRAGMSGAIQNPQTPQG
jgi:hypothetical protein